LVAAAHRMLLSAGKLRFLCHFYKEAYHAPSR